MADQKISQLTDGTSFQAGDEAVVNRSGTNYKVDPTQFGSLTVEQSIGATLDLKSTSTTIGTNNVLGSIDFSSQDSDSAGVNARIDAYAVNTVGATALRLQTSESFSTTLVPRLNIANNGDISFYEDTGTTPKFFWDASAESLGIGTSSPAAPLHVNGGSSGGFTTVKHLELGFTAGRGLTISTSHVVAIDDLVTFDAPTATYGQMAFKTAGSERMRIDSSGNVGIGTSSPGEKLEIGLPSAVGGAESRTLQINRGVTGQYATFSAEGGQTTIGSANTVGGRIVFTGDGTERMRIDSSGKVGIGTSSPSRILHTSGDIVRFDNNGTSAILLLDTTNNEGFRIVTNKDSGAFSIEDMGTNVTGAGTERLRIDASGNLLVGTTTSPSDTGTVVADGIYLGGTGAANLLDDYETGTWTPQYTNTTPPTTPYTMDIVSANYVKIGSTVIVTANIRTDSVDTTGAIGALRISGLPFTCGSSAGGVSVFGAVDWGGDFPSSGFVNPASTQIILLYRSSANGATLENNAADLTSGVTANQNVLQFSAVYFVA